MQFLTAALADSNPACIYMHRPVFGRKDNAEVGAVVAQGAALHDLFKSHNVKMVCEGHDHVFNHQTHDGIEYYISGGAGAPLDAPPQEGGFFHFLIVHVKGSSISVDVIPMGAISVTRSGDEWDLGNYSDYDIQARYVVVGLARKPSEVKAVLDKKGKPKDVPSALGNVTGSGDHWQAHVSVLLTAHGKTELQFG